MLDRSFLNPGRKRSKAIFALGDSGLSSESIVVGLAFIDISSVFSFTDDSGRSIRFFVVH